MFEKVTKFFVGIAIWIAMIFLFGLFARTLAVAFMAGWSLLG